MPEVSHLLDFTIIYKTNKTSAWNFACGDMNDVKVIAKAYELPKEILVRLPSDTEYKNFFQSYVNKILEEKSRLRESTKKSNLTLN